MARRLRGRGLDIFEGTGGYGRRHRGPGAHTLVVTILVVGGSLFTSIMGGFAFARLRFPGRNILFLIVLATMMIPYPVTMVPLYIGFNKLGWVNSFRPATSAGCASAPT